MKTVFNTALLFLLPGLFPVFSQGNNLQFNRVVYYELQLNDTIGTNPYMVADSVVITVPINKVLKIESAFENANGSIFLNGVRLITGSTPFPIWLPTGSYIFKLEDSCDCGGCSSCTFTGGANSFLSGIEFNIVP